MPIEGIQKYYTAIRELQARIIEGQLETLSDVAGRMAAVVKNEGRIFIFGTGHSHMLAEEAYYRAGGLAATVPMFTPAILMLHESARMSSQVERMGELAAPILDEYQPQPGEILFVYADSGSNMLPVQLAIEARERGVIVVGVCSFKYARVAPLSSLGKRLDEVVDYALDNGGTPGDALVEIEDFPWRVGASSTIAGALLWNCLLTETVYRLRQEGAELPVVASFNMAGAADHNEAILQKWSRVNPHLPSRGLKKQ